jgi:hypothetical protein
MKHLKPLYAILISVVMLASAIGIAASTSSRPLNLLAIGRVTTENAVFDFETNTTEGWESSTVYPTSAEAYHGQYSLAMVTHLDYSNPDLRQGMAFVMCQLPPDVYHP